MVMTSKVARLKNRGIPIPLVAWLLMDNTMMIAMTPMIVVLILFISSLRPSPLVLAFIKALSEASVTFLSSFVDTLN